MHDVFYFTDVHGCWDLFYAMREWCYEQDPECTIIFGGDACDRGPCGYNIMKAILEDPQMIYIKGNHEDLFVKAATSIYNHKQITNPLTREEAENIINVEIMQGNHNVSLHLMNGGKPTLVSWLMEGASTYFVDRIKTLSMIYSYENIDFCHAGATYPVFKKVADAEYNNTELDEYTAEKIIWDRNALEMGWEKDRICVFGHTPTIALPAALYGCDKSEDKAHPCAYTGLFAEERFPGKKVDMDTGMVWTGRGYVLNVLTMMVTGFLDKEPDSYEVNKAPVVKAFENYKII